VTLEGNNTESIELYNPGALNPVEFENAVYAAAFTLASAATALHAVYNIQSQDIALQVIGVLNAILSVGSLRIATNILSEGYEPENYVSEAQIVQEPIKFIESDESDPLTDGNCNVCATTVELKDPETYVCGKCFVMYHEDCRDFNKKMCGTKNCDNDGTNWMQYNNENNKLERIKTK